MPQAAARCRTPRHSPFRCGATGGGTAVFYSPCRFMPASVKEYRPKVREAVSLAVKTERAAAEATPAEEGMSEIVETLPWEGDVLPFRGLECKQVNARPGQPPIVILPGFGNNTQDYTFPFGEEEESIAAALRARGFKVYVVDVLRKDWFKVARALLTMRYWRKACTTDPGYTWYLDRVAKTVRFAMEDSGSSKVDIVGHSAGGWLARAFTGDKAYFDGGLDVNPAVRRLVTLGTPHLPPPDPKRDVTAGTLAWIGKQFTGEWLAEHGISCTCVCGRAVRGNRQAEKETFGRYAYGSYDMVCGEGDGIEGDCVVPLNSAFIEGTQHIILDGVFHSMSRIGTFGEKAERPWYGSCAAIDAWLSCLVDQQ